MERVGVERNQADPVSGREIGSGASPDFLKRKPDIIHRVIV